MYQNSNIYFFSDPSTLLKPKQLSGPTQLTFDEEYATITDTQGVAQGLMTNPDNQRLNTTEKTGVFQPNQVVALGLKTNPDDLMTTEKTGIFDGTVSQFLTLSLQTQSKELLRTFIRDIS